MLDTQDHKFAKITQGLKPEWRSAFMQVCPNTRMRAVDICGFATNPQRAGTALTALTKRGLLEKTKWTQNENRVASYKLTTLGLNLRQHLEGRC